MRRHPTFPKWNVLCGSFVELEWQIMINQGFLKHLTGLVHKSYAANSSKSVLNILFQSDSLFIMHNASNSAMTVLKHIFMSIVIDIA